ncbi:MAG: RdgB/HAM1 family non-canonical purine NTP pyrophosphatase [Clostridia bacterium]|jgi:XTP/dITP diphosphohydrolase|nr:RdgB/HAM1 family non-canonical purine NTP pyrophosphatase [Clostridia bacterium]
MEILIATNNEAKRKEIQEILTEYEIITLKQANLNIKIKEDKNTFEENALKKAVEIYNKTKIPCIADDSGICIEEYEGWPGVKTARFLGEDKSTAEYASQRNEYIIEKMKKLPKERRKVSYITVIAYFNGKEKYIEKAKIEGYISEKPRGENGFGFDEIFELKNGKTLAELTAKEKNEISSRKIALEKIKRYIK